MRKIALLLFFVSGFCFSQSELEFKKGARIVGVLSRKDIHLQNLFYFALNKDQWFGFTGICTKLKNEISETSFFGDLNRRPNTGD